MEVGKKAKVEVVWEVLPIDYSQEKENNMATLMANKLGLPRESVRVVPRFVRKDESGNDVLFTNDIVTNIQDPQFQLRLFDDYVRRKGIEDADMDAIRRIDAEVNALIDYDHYDKFRRYSVKWLKWDNFMSYGPDNFMDFTKFKGLVLLNGKPANQSGKTTFAIELLKFLLFGRTKYDTLGEIFNNFLPESTEVRVEGCLTIEGEDYVIRRTLTRPALAKRSDKSKVSQKIEYFKVLDGGGVEELADVENASSVENKAAEDGMRTNQLIKEAIGNEKDFDLTICTTAKNLDDLVEFKDTERGRLLSRWIGLLPLEEKDKVAREKYNKEVAPTLLSTRYSREALRQEIEDIKVNIDNLQKDIEGRKRSMDESRRLAEETEREKETFLSSKRKVDPDIVKIDITTLNATMSRVKEEGVRMKAVRQKYEEELAEIGQVSFDEAEYKDALRRDKELTVEQASLKNEIKRLKDANERLRNGEYCPTCKRKLDNVDNSPLIEENKKEIQKFIGKGVANKSELEAISKSIQGMEDDRKRYDRKMKLEILVDKTNAELKSLAAQYREEERRLQDYNANKEAIDQNNKIDIEINNLTAKINAHKAAMDRLSKDLVTLSNQVTLYQGKIEEREKVIRRIKEEEKLMRDWKLYLEMVGKNGVSKVVLRNTLPVINGELRRLLNGVCDFVPEVRVTDKNEVIFDIVADGVRSRLSGASGFELTCSSLALRTVLANLSTIPKLNFMVMDELLGRVAAENLENMKLLYEKIAQNYDFILHISHLESVIDWHDSIVTVSKKGHVSVLTVTEGAGAAPEKKEEPAPEPPRTTETPKKRRKKTTPKEE